MKRIVPTVFVLLAIGLAVFFIFHKSGDEEENDTYKIRDITPIAESTNMDIHSTGVDSDSSISMTSFITLKGDETLISTLSADFDNDGYDDQIVAIKRSFSPYLILIVGLYNPAAQVYERSGEIATEITQSKTFSYTNMDLTGEHKNALVYQGYLDNGDSVLKAYLFSRKNSSYEIREIANFKSDGTIFIQQSDRVESYEMAQAKGSSFPIWVYLSDNSKEGSLDQLQRQYDWSSTAGKYILTKEVKVPGSRLAAKEVEKILDGTVDSFARFLNGMWYKTATNGDETRYLLFDYSNKEIIFLLNDTEEVYNWVNSNVRRNGMYISGVNIDISSLERRFDIVLEGTDSVRLRVQDAVRMPINENTQWDGQYKKMAFQRSFRTTASENLASDSKAYIEFLEKIKDWHLSDGNKITFETGHYSVNNDTGDYASVLVPEDCVIQFRSSLALKDSSSALSGMYRIKGELDEDTADDDEYSRIILTPVVISPNGIMLADKKDIVLEKDKEAEEIEPVVEEVVATKEENPPPVISAILSPSYFSPDGDGSNDTLSIKLKASSQNPITSWSFTVNDPETRKVFWSKSGTTVPSKEIIWDGKNSKGERVQSATDYPYVFTVTDSKGSTAVSEGFVQVDVLVIKEGAKLKLQVPSIIFRSNNADFKSISEVAAGPAADRANKGLNQVTIDNNIRVLRRISEILQKFRDYKVTIEGNANNLSGTSSEESEVQQLSLERARFVRNWLIENGDISASRLTATGN
ncbi:MAG: pallilysin-related adhesin, partial [Treponema sp.]|nr:pallilysin-related adhesin [Treponema sp.]